MCMRVSPSDSGNSGILYIGFNQDYGCFAVGMQNGFRIFNADPLKQLERHEFDVRDGTGVGYLEMLFRTNLLGVLGGGYHSRLPNNMFCLWDGIRQQFVLEFTCVSEVKAVRLTHDRIVVVLIDSIKVYTFSPSSQLVYESLTCANPLGLCYVCQNVDNPLIVFPSRKLGSVFLVHVRSSQATSNSSTSSSPSSTSVSTNNATNMPPRQIVAHENSLASLSLNREGSLLATASVKGTIIRIFSTKDCTLLQELRRGTNNATITCLAFNVDSDLLCVASERGTAHIFCLRKDYFVQHGSSPSASSQTSSPILGGAGGSSGKKTGSQVAQVPIGSNSNVSYVFDY